MKPKLLNNETQTKSNTHVVSHLLTVLECGYQFEGKEIFFQDCDQMAKFIGFMDFNDLQKKVTTPKTFKIIVTCS